MTVTEITFASAKEVAVSECSHPRIKHTVQMGDVCSECEADAAEVVRDLRSRLAAVTKERDEARGDRDFFDAERVKAIGDTEDVQSKLATAVEALEKIASWEDGQGVAIYDARRALASIRGKEISGGKGG